jgi:hypothetical protein
MFALTRIARSRYSFLVLALACISSNGSAAAAANKKPDRLDMRVSHHIATAESDVVVRMRVEPDARSRELTVEWIADDLSGGSHAITLDGARAAATHQYSIKRMSPGHYTVTAILRLDDGREIRRSSNVTVLGAGGPDVGGVTQGSADGLRPPRRR